MPRISRPVLQTPFKKAESTNNASPSPTVAGTSRSAASTEIATNQSHVFSFPSSRRSSRTRISSSRRNPVREKHAERPKRKIFFSGTLQSVTNGALTRLARRGGVRRASFEVFEEMRKVLKIFLKRAIENGIMYLEHSKKKTLSLKCILLALKRQNLTLYM